MAERTISPQAEHWILFIAQPNIFITRITYTTNKQTAHPTVTRHFETSELILFIDLFGKMS